ncbi:MAG: hypothetical protein JRG83_05230 [Deltaproteobacteria bacterium]|nr:hypothetical protein [Deltaproteobacteria bacterium]
MHLDEVRRIEMEKPAQMAELVDFAGGQNLVLEAVLEIPVVELPAATAEPASKIDVARGT